jgi:sec-independent protein translocase protein TatA
MPAFTVTPLFLGPLEMGVLFLIVVLIFGASKIPEVARSSGEAMGEFKKGRQDIEEELENYKSEAVETEPE